MAQELKYKVGDIVTLPTERPLHWAKSGDMDKFLGQTVQITGIGGIFSGYNSTGPFRFEGSCPWLFLLSDLEYKTNIKTKIMKFKVGDRVKITDTSEYWFDGDSANPKNVEGSIDYINNSDYSLPIGVKWDNNTHNDYDEIDLELVNIQTNTKMTTNQLMKDAALAVANKLLKANNTVTTLEIKVELRKTDPEFFWDQATVSNLMDEFAQEGKFTYTDNGTYRIYSSPLGSVAASQTAVGIVNPPTNTTSTGTATVITVPGGVTGSKGTSGYSKPKTSKKTITRSKALDLVQNSKGHFFKVIFTKTKDGSERTMNCQYVKGQTVSPLGVVKVKETSLQKKLKQTGDINTIPSKSVIRSFNINNLKVLGIGGKLYKVN
jgi:ribosomal protein S17